MSIEVTVQGQPVLINEFNSVVRINIDPPFQDPSYRMKDRWQFRCSGFGINDQIIDILFERKFRLFVHEAESNRDYIIEFEKLEKFLKGYNVDYKVKDTKMKILSKSYFTEL